MRIIGAVFDPTAVEAICAALADQDSAAEDRERSRSAADTRAPPGLRGNEAPRPAHP